MKKVKNLLLCLTTFILFAEYSSIFAQVGTVNADASRKPKLVVLASYHMANPGRDRARSETDDVLQPKRQKEIAELVQLLKRFKPTKIAVECSPKNQPRIENDYQKYLKGEYELKSGEEEQIGFRLAKEMRLEKLNCVDWNDYPIGDISNYDYDEFAQKDPELKSFLEKRSQELQESVTKTDKILKNLSVVEQYRFLNQTANLDESHQRYFDFVRIGRGDQYVGANYLSHWYGRNMKIFANLIRITDSPCDRVLVIYGAGHAKLLNQFAEESGYYDVESALRYLTKTKSAKTFDGGDAGNKHILELLEVAAAYMHEKSRLYLPVHTLTDYHQTLKAAVSRYQTKLIATKHLPTKDFVEKNLDFYLQLNEMGLIRIFRRGQNWFSNGYVYELSCLESK